MLMFWEILRMSYYEEVKIGTRFISDSGIIYYSEDKVFKWQDSDEDVSAQYDDLNWEQI